MKMSYNLNFDLVWPKINVLGFYTKVSPELVCSLILSLLYYCLILSSSGGKTGDQMPVRCQCL